MIPVDLVSCPYMIVTCYGEHTHVPPPPSILSEDLKAGLLAVILPMLTPGLTRGKSALYASVTRCNNVLITFSRGFGVLPSPGMG